MNEQLAGIVRNFHAAFKPPMAVHSAEDAVRALDLIIAGDRLPVGDAVILARRVRRFIHDARQEAP
jgi:hypothetical protein